MASRVTRTQGTAEAGVPDTSSSVVFMHFGNILELGSRMVRMRQAYSSMLQGDRCMIWSSVYAVDHTLQSSACMVYMCVIRRHDITLSHTIVLAVT